MPLLWGFTGETSDSCLFAHLAYINVSNNATTATLPTRWALLADAPDQYLCN